MAVPFTIIEEGRGGEEGHCEEDCHEKGCGGEEEDGGKEKHNKKDYSRQKGGVSPSFPLT